MSDQDQQQSSRNKFTTQAWLVYRDKRAACDLLNLSPAGCLLLTSIDLSPGSVFQLELTLPDTEEPISVKTVVMAEMMVDDQPAIDARFIEVPDEVRALLRRYLKRSVRPTEKLKTV